MTDTQDETQDTSDESAKSAPAKRRHKNKVREEHYFEDAKANLLALVSGEWSPKLRWGEATTDDPLKEIKPSSRRRRRSRKVETKFRQDRLAEAGIKVTIGDDDPGLPSTDKALKMVGRSKYLSWIWKAMTGEDPENPIALGGKRGPMTQFDRDVIEVEFATQAALLGESWIDILDVLRSAVVAGGRTKIAERQDLERYYEDKVAKNLSRNGRDFGGVIGSGSKVIHHSVKAEVANAPVELLWRALGTALQNADPSKSYSTQVVFSEAATWVVKSTAYMCLTEGYPYASFIEACRLAGANVDACEKCWFETTGRIEANLPTAGRSKLFKVAGDTATSLITQAIHGAVASSSRSSGNVKIKIAKKSDRLALQQTEPKKRSQAAHDHSHDETCTHGTKAPEPEPQVSQPRPQPIRQIVAESVPEDPIAPEHDDGGAHRPVRARYQKLNPEQVKKREALRDEYNGKACVNFRDLIVDKVSERVIKNGKMWESSSIWKAKSHEDLKRARFWRTIEMIEALMDRVRDPGAHFALGTVLGHAFAIAGFPQRIVDMIASSAKLPQIRTAFKQAVENLKNKKKNANTSLFMSPFILMNSKFTRGEILQLHDALVQDSMDARIGFEARMDLMPTMPWCNFEQRAIHGLHATADRLRKQGFKTPEAALNILKEAACCMQAQSVMSCEEHGVRDIRAARCKRDVACPYCRGLQAEILAHWVLNYASPIWPENLIVYTFSAATEAWVEDDTESVVEGSDGAETDAPVDDEAPKKRRKKKRRLSTDMYDRLVYGLKQHKDVKQLSRVLKRIAKKGVRETNPDGSDTIRRYSIGFRGFLGATETYLAFPKYSPLVEDEHEPIDEQSEGYRLTTDLLRENFLLETMSPVEFTREEFVTFLISKRLEVGRVLDRALIELSYRANDCESITLKNAQESDVSRKTFQNWIDDGFEGFFREAWTLRNRALYVMRNKAAEQQMPWYKPADVKMILDGIAERDDVPLGKCDQVITGEDGKPSRRCLKTLEVLSEHCRTGHILAHNNDGIVPRTRELWEIAARAGCLATKRLPASRRHLRELASAPT
jgi:hypothetical protein